MNVLTRTQKEKGKAASSTAKAAPSAKELAQDPALRALGFGAQAAPDAAADSEVGHEADTGRAHALDGGNYRKDEIDDLFKEGHVASQKNKGAKKKKKASSKERGDKGDTGDKSKKAKKEKSYGLEKVFDAIASTKKKKSKKRDREAEGDAKGKAKKSKKQKKNFVMS